MRIRITTTMTMKTATCLAMCNSGSSNLLHLHTVRHWILNRSFLEAAEGRDHICRARYLLMKSQALGPGFFWSSEGESPQTIDFDIAVYIVYRSIYSPVVYFNKI